MNNGELKEYLNGFPDDASLSVILVNPKKRKLYEINKIYIGSDFGHPVFFIDVGKESDMDEEIVKACEEDENVAGQMEIEDFPEYMPDGFNKNDTAN
jgi:hypothetical protein|nr:MAG TPA: hypothetical protein [Bacteriophage sp.]